ncbi:unnamed protein product [Citrullus colocynthis]|uniref:Uncharacterized protein n=1 Tax=Citrullus colocynthis TaxID=252529 RepID=A0ABP0XZQ3_9ROSI
MYMYMATPTERDRELWKSIRRKEEMVNCWHTQIMTMLEMWKIQKVHMRMYS